VPLQGAPNLPTAPKNAATMRRSPTPIHNGRPPPTASSCQATHDRRRAANPPRPTRPPTAKNGASSTLFSFFRFYETPKNGASISPNAVWN